MGREARRLDGGRWGNPPGGIIPVARLGEDEGRQALLVGGVVQSISPFDSDRAAGYWGAMVPSHPPTRALILGLGGATLAHLLAQRFGPSLRIVGVDDDVGILETARAAGWLDVPNLELVQGDAFAFIEDTTERFDYAALDLYRGQAFVGASLTRPFLRRLRDLLDPPGQVALNLCADSRLEVRVERFERVFRIVDRVRVGGNVVLHGRAPRG